MLWCKVKPGLSAGRVQSAATRLVVDRERERMAFVSAEYWDVDATAATPATGSGTRPSACASSAWTAGPSPAAPTSTTRAS